MQPPRHGQPQPDRESGAVIIEFALVGVLFLVILWGIVAYGVLFAAYQSVHHASAEAARSALAVDPASAETHAETVAADNLDWLDNTPGALAVDATSAACDYDNSLTCLTVTVEYDWETAPLLPSPFPGQVAMPSTLTSTTIIQLAG